MAEPDATADRHQSNNTIHIDNHGNLVFGTATNSPLGAPPPADPPTNGWWTRWRKVGAFAVGVATVVATAVAVLAYLTDPPAGRSSMPGTGPGSTRPLPVASVLPTAGAYPPPTGPANRSDGAAPPHIEHQRFATGRPAVAGPGDEPALATSPAAGRNSTQPATAGPAATVEITLPRDGDDPQASQNVSGFATLPPNHDILLFWEKAGSGRYFAQGRCARKPAWFCDPPYHGMNEGLGAYWLHVVVLDAATAAKVPAGTFLATLPHGVAQDEVWVNGGNDQ